MKKKALLAVLCVLLAGVGYRLSREAQIPTGASEETVLILSESEESGPPEISEVQDPEESGPQEMETEEQKAFSEPVTQSLCYIHICGAVNRPGVYSLETGSRIFQAVEAAGGFTEAAAEGYLNMAEPVADGMKIIVPEKTELSGLELYGLEEEETGSFVQAPEGSEQADDSSPEKVNLNTASKEELMTLTGIGESRAEDIIRYREDYGPFEKIEDVMQVSGIKDAAFEKIRDEITV